MASPDELLAMLEEAAVEAENAQNRDFENEYEETLDELVLELIDESALGVCFEVHRACKTGTFMLDETDIDSEAQYRLKDEKGRDVFGQLPSKKQLECVCPNCQRNLAASRFAPHLEKCMGMGRTSSRVASRRIRKTGTKENDNDSCDDEDEPEWIADKKAKRLKRDRSTNSPRRGKNKKAAAERSITPIPNVGSNDSGGSGSQPQPYEGMSKEERRTLLLTTCGVISEHTKKLCTRSMRCPQHSDDQRRGVRIQLLGRGDDEIVDIDTYEEGDSQALRDSLALDRASNPSPAGSSSTNNSTGSKSRKKGSKSRKKGASKTSGSTGSAADSTGSRTNTPSNLFEFP